MKRDEISALLPFLANETLSGNERAAVEAAVADDPTLKAELQALRAIRQTMQAEDVQSPGEFGAARLMRDAAAEPNVEPTRQTSQIWKIAAAVLLAVVVGQFVLLQSPSDAPTGYELAGGAGPDLIIAISPDTTEADLRALLSEAGVEIIGGPSALGLYELGIVTGDSVNAIKVLEGSPLLESVQRMGE